MHSKLRAVAILLAVFACFSATSCINVDKTLGANNIPDDQQLKLRTVTFHLPLENRMMDSLQSLNSSYAYLGALRTKEFGLSTFSFATNFAPYNEGSDLGTSRVIKSIHIALPIDSKTITDPSQDGLPQNVHVYRMTRVVDTTYRYNSDLKESEWIHTPIDSGGVIYTGRDSLHIRLKNSFGSEILRATQAELDSNTVFIKKFKGLLFTVENPQEGINGGRLNGFDLSSGSMYVTFNFQPTWQDGLPRKDTTIVLVVTDGVIQNFSTYSSKPLEKSTPQEYVYAEGVGGLKPFVDPAVLKDTIDRWIAKMGYDPSKIIIGKATYYLPFVTSDATVSDLNAYFPEYLYPAFRQKDTSSYIYYTPLDDVNSTGNEVGAINRSLSHYSGDISSTVQKMVNKNKTEILKEWKKYAMWFCGVNSSTTTSYYTSASTTTYSLDRSRYFIGRINGPLHANYPTLHILYTILED